MVYITRKEHFNAAHRVYNPKWDDAKNSEIFGKCANPNWHGHNYQMFITVKGTVNPETGFLVNLKDLSILLKKEIVDKIDHKNLNLEVDFLKNTIPSTENLTIAIWNELKEKITHLGAALHSVKIVETEKNSVEYFGE